MHSSNCLNCGTPVQSKFCPDCGQKTDTHRITAKHFILHDVVHGVWHVDKGILFTAKEVLTRPGYAARDYIAGKRVRYYNVFYLMLLVMGLLMIVSGYVGESTAIIDNIGDKAFEVILSWIVQNIKFVLFVLVPVFAFNSYIFFKKLKLNYFEHIVIAAFTLLGMYLVVLALVLIELLPTAVTEITDSLFLFVVILFPVWAYYQAARGVYKFPGFTIRMACFYAFLFFELLLLMFIPYRILKHD